MMLGTPSSLGGSDPELLVGMMATTALAGFGVWAFLKRMVREPVAPDPWNRNIAAEIETEAATPLCHRCLTAHGASADFCPDCGAAVGQYTNWLPYPYLFSLGHALRIGTSGEFRRSPFTVFGYLLFSLYEYALFAPVYWILMLRSLGKQGENDKTQQPSSPSSEKPVL